MADKKEYVYRFKCWATMIDKTPETALERDEDGVPYNLYEFSLWIQAMWSAWRKLNGLKWDAPLWDEDHQRFDTWLAQRVGFITT
jgi:hypothetical protein